MRKMNELLKIAAFTPGENGTQGLPVILWGAVGRAKTALGHQFAAYYAFAYRAMHLANYEPTDLSILMPNQETKALEPYIHKTFLECFENKYTMLFLDELSHASAATQAVAMPILLDRVIGDRKLPPSVGYEDKKTFIVAAANPPGVAAMAGQMKMATCNRMTHIDIDKVLPVDELVDPWIEYTENCGGDAKLEKQEDPDLIFQTVEREWPSVFATESSKVARFIQANPDLLQAPPEGAWRPSADVSSYAFPTMRSVSKVPRINAICKILAISDDMRRAFIRGTVGDAWTSQFCEWEMDFQNLPEPKRLLDGEIEFMHQKHRPDRTQIVLASCLAIVNPKGQAAQKAASTLTEQRTKNLWTLISDIAAQDGSCVDFLIETTERMMKLGLTRGAFRKVARPVMLKLNPLFAE